MRFKLTVLVCASAVVIGALVSLSLKALAQTNGERITFLVPRGTLIGSDDERDRIVVTGPSQGTTAASNCGVGGHIQQIVAIFPGSGAAATRADAIFQVTEPLHPGTELNVEVPLGLCLSTDGTVYDKYEGTVTRGHDSQQDSGERVQTRVELLQPSCGCGQAE